MGIVDIFSKRQRRMRGEFPDVYQYDDLPIGFRNQVVYILDDVFSLYYGHPYESSTIKFTWFKDIHDVLARELVISQPQREDNPWMAVTNFFLNTTNVDDALSVIEASFITARLAQQQERLLRFKMTADDGVNELNARFSEHGIGYQLGAALLRRRPRGFLRSGTARAT